MYRQESLLGIKPLLEKHLENLGFVLVDLRFYKDGQNQIVLEVLADRTEGGITLDECVRLNRELGDIVDNSGLAGQGYILDVSSPGMDRPLATEADFRRNISRRVRVFLKEAWEGRIEYCGEIVAVDETGVVLNAEKKTVRIPLDIINKAKQVII
ncbi:MAG: ribosome maturation factor RimP [Candidatus Omnitrophica bacterium]|nr:ribosome maturation factor RimP [Candidatus Omnitrophota bacterium]